MSAVCSKVTSWIRIYQNLSIYRLLFRVIAPNANHGKTTMVDNDFNNATSNKLYNIGKSLSSCILMQDHHTNRSWLVVGAGMTS